MSRLPSTITRQSRPVGSRLWAASALRLCFGVLWLTIAFLLTATSTRLAASLPDPSLTNLFINELLFNPPFGDLTNEFIEIRGVPNYVLPSGTYLVAVEGDAEENPGTIQNRFDLSGRRIGQNGFLVLLQQFHRYKTIPYSTVLTNSDSGSGWGSGSDGTSHAACP